MFLVLSLLLFEEPPVHFVRVEYDLRTVTDAIRHSELPHEFAEDLEHGGAAANVRH